MSLTWSFDIVHTPIGPLIYYWSEMGIEKVEILAEYPKGKPAPFFDLSLQIFAFFQGENVDFSHYPLNLSKLSSFELEVLNIVRAIPYAETLTYGDVAERVGHIGFSQAVGQVLRRNPFPILIPCHRVRRRTGLGGYSFGEGRPDKFYILELERGQQSLFAP